MMNAPGAADASTAYAAARGGGKSAAARHEVWLRGNVRPMLAGGLVLVAAAALGTAAAGRAGAGPVVVGVLGVVTALLAVVAAGLVRAASGPRVGRRGDALVLRLSPWRTESVPLGVVECVFPGSQPLDGPVLRHVHGADEDGPPADRRVGTLVIRFAERATEWRARPTFAPWGTWHDGHVIVDGRWCEPLSTEVARTIGQRLLEAKREAAVAGPGR